MLDIRLIRAEPERVKAELAKVGFPAADLDALLEADRRRREALHALETLRAERTNAAQRTVGERIAAAEETAAAAEADFERRMLEVPNLPHPDVPVGPDESANVVVRTVGEPRRFDFPALAHWDLGPQLGVIDFERGVKISGSRFYVLRGRTPAARAHHLDARSPHARARLRRDLPAGHGQARVPGRHREPSQVRRQPLPRRRGGPVVRPHGRG